MFHLEYFLQNVPGKNNGKWCQTSLNQELVSAFQSSASDNSFQSRSACEGAFCCPFANKEFSNQGTDTRLL